ncbi:Uncharacterized conserved protein [Phaffia rhodozyma]|uniref:Uncharacterized conserved protein n=1 Tax=Phaffia rhodozyma TaxID=264483 RepID=A0A0F7SEV1_PHARH|nr:Uncharacterized conserved protein [Phaffia rhodozyma]
MPPRTSEALNPAQPSLDSWLSIPPTVSELHPDPALITYSDPIFDKDSIFISLTFPITSPPTTYQIRSLIKQYMSPPHHPKLPKVLQRGDGVSPTHRMYAWKCLVLKKGRDGTGGEVDYEVREGSDDDGEKYGADRILMVMEGAIDCITFCCRWFGGEMLGPIRFHHIQTTSTESVTAHMSLADLHPLLLELEARDSVITDLRGKLSAPTPKAADYSDLTLEKAQRLLVARSKTIEQLHKRVRELIETDKVTVETPAVNVEEEGEPKKDVGDTGNNDEDGLGTSVLNQDLGDPHKNLSTEESAFLYLKIEYPHLSRHTSSLHLQASTLYLYHCRSTGLNSVHKSEGLATSTKATISLLLAELPTLYPFNTFAILLYCGISMR